MLANQNLPNAFFVEPGSEPVTPKDVYGIQSDELMRLLELKARRDHPREKEVLKYVPALLNKYLELCSKKNFMVDHFFTELLINAPY